jgi:hypothetical protein
MLCKGILLGNGASSLLPRYSGEEMDRYVLCPRSSGIWRTRMFRVLILKRKGKDLGVFIVEVGMQAHRQA